MLPNAYFRIFLFFCANLSSVEGCSDSTLSPFPQQSVPAGLTASWRGCNEWWSSCYKTMHSPAHIAPGDPLPWLLRPLTRTPRAERQPPRRPLHTSSRPWATPALSELLVKYQVIPHPERSSTPRPADLLSVLRSQTAHFRIPFLNTQIKWIALILPFQVISLGFYQLICHTVIYVFTWLFLLVGDSPHIFFISGSLELNTIQCKFFKI